MPFLRQLTQLFHINQRKFSIFFHFGILKEVKRQTSLPKKQINKLLCFYIHFPSSVHFLNVMENVSSMLLLRLHIRNRLNTLCKEKNGFTYYSYYFVHLKWENICITMARSEKNRFGAEYFKFRCWLLG